MAADQFTVENGLAAQALTTTTTAPIAAEPWADGSALLYSAADGKLHPVPVAPLAGAIVSVNAIPPLASSGGVAPIISLTGIVEENHGGFGSDVSGLGTGLIAHTAANTWAARSIAQGAGITVTDGDGSAGNPTVGLTNDSVTINTSGGITGGGAAALGSSLSLSLSAIPNSALADSSLTVTAGTGLDGGGAVALGSSVSLSLPNTGTSGTYAYPSSLTTDAQGRVSSITAGSAPTDKGSSVMLAQVSSNGGAGWIFAGDYFGLSQMTESSRATATNVIPWVAPCAGTLKNFRTWTVAAAPSNSAFTVYQAATSSTPSYSATAAVINIASGAHLGADTTHELAIAAGDLIIFTTDTTWNNPGFCVQAQFIPATS